MKSLCASCKNKIACDEHRRCYGYPNFRVKECKGYEAHSKKVMKLIQRAKNENQ